MRHLLLLGVALVIFLGLGVMGFSRFQEDQTIEFVRLSSGITWPDESTLVRAERSGPDSVVVVTLPEGSVEAFLAKHPQLTAEQCPWGAGTRPKWRCGTGPGRVGDQSVSWSVSLDLSKRKLTVSAHAL